VNNNVNKLELMFDDDFFRKKVLFAGKVIPMIKCFYCGSVDHVEREHIIPNIYTSRSGRRTFKKGEIVPACRECNGAKGSRLWGCVEDICDELINHYHRKYRGELATGDWDETELQELGPILRGKIKASFKVKEDIEERIEHLSVVATGNYLPSEGGVFIINPKLSRERQLILEVITDLDTYKMSLAKACVKHNIDHRLMGRIRRKSVFKDVWAWYEQNKKMGD
jgi:hypothetical protein